MSASAKGRGGGAMGGLTSSSSPIEQVRYAERGAPEAEACQVHQSTSVGRPLLTTDSGGRGRRALSAPGIGDGVDCPSPLQRFRHPLPAMTPNSRKLVLDSRTSAGVRTFDGEWAQMCRNPRRASGGAAVPRSGAGPPFAPRVTDFSEFHTF